jgi:hypothetical protein
MPWRGPEYRGEFPTLGYAVADWIETYLIVPDGLRMGLPYLLTDEMLTHLLWSYRLHPDARPEQGSMAFAYYGVMLVRPQKWGKDPFGAAQVWCQALGEVQFDGWDSRGEPVGRPVPTPWIQCAGNAEEQCDNTFRPIITMGREGPLCDVPGLDIGEGRVNLPNGGRIEPVTASARARQGARLTYTTLTESHLMVESSGGLKLGRTLKRNAAGMDGRWLEITNAWDPSEQSVAQQTYEAKAPGVFVDYRPPRARIDLDDDAALRAELAYVYGDSEIGLGGWVRKERIMADIRDPATGEGEARRYFLNEVSVGSKDAVDAIKWAAQARLGEPLQPGARICLGFHGSQTKDATSLVAARINDGRLYHLRTWERPAHLATDQWEVPRDEVDMAVRDAFKAFEVFCMFASPATWQTEVNAWAGQWEKRVLELWLNSEMRMDQVVERFETAHRGDEITHDGSAVLTTHALGAALANGRRRASAEERQPGQTDHYMRVVRKSWGVSTSAFLAALLAYEARGWAIEHGALVDEGPPNLW